MTYQVNIYEINGDWFAAIYADGEFDTTVELDAADRDEALAEARSMELMQDAGGRTVKVI